ncbi:DUF6503 family protein [uncultured Croceitalea sp.]|uniref:DUF6503 family protein n=1 Tax=uncultured Croceitalea sp. TaxID=1798908 RepID=UPI0033059A5E
MKQYFFLSLLLIAASCKQQAKETNEETETATAEKQEMAMAKYPGALSKVFDAHGGLELWKRQRTLQYDMPTKSATETHTVDLYNRKDRIATKKFTMGFDGKQPWLLDASNQYEGNVEFYHNLMFYFYAMPFVLADDGIVYGDTEDLVFDGESYPGVRISYNAGIGTTPKDEYFIHFDSKTHQMAWLGYTVTYRSGEKSDNVKWIRYNDWRNVNGLVLPQSMTWYDYEGRTIKDAKSTRSFENISLKETSMPASFYTKPPDAVYWEKPSEE